MEAESPMIPLFKVHMPASVDHPLLETLHSGFIAQGPKVDRFEEEFGKTVACDQAIALNSGTAALTIALRLAGVGPRNGVITSPMTCTATNLPILSLGGTPIWADVDPRSGLIDPADIRKRIRGSALPVQAIMCVDWGGAPCDLTSLLEICAEFDIPLIEDAAHALGATYYGVPVGAVANMTCFSLQAIKHITMGDGGVLTCLDRAQYLRGRKLRWFGIDRDAPAEDTRIDQDIEEWGYKAHANDLAATIGLRQLPHLPWIVNQHRYNATQYDVELDSYFKVPPRVPGVESAYWIYTILLPSAQARDAFRLFMLERGIQVSRVHRRNDDYTVFKPFGGIPLHGVDEFSERMICIPVHWNLSTDQRDHIIQSSNEFARQRGH